MSAPRLFAGSSVALVLAALFPRDADRCERERSFKGIVEKGQSRSSASSSPSGGASTTLTTELASRRALIDRASS
jgi:hypothetical protein